MKIIIPRPENEQDHRLWWCIDLLRKALAFEDYTKGECIIQFSEKLYPQQAAMDILTNGGLEIDVKWSMASMAREQHTLPVRIPICKGLLGYRVLIIRQADLARFRAIRTLRDLSKLVGVQEKNWPDVEILRANGLRIETVEDYNSIFGLLDAGSFDYFPRSVTEPRYELALHANSNLALEGSLLLHYQAPLIYYVNVRLPELRDRIEAGLRRIFDDGSFDELFYNHPTNKATLMTINFSQRRCFELDNPTLSPETAALSGDSRYWYPAGLEQMKT